MTHSKSQKKPNKRRISDQKRLESWKAIANYLHRSVRTVRRWEGDEGLPVHRHKHSSGSSVHAYCAELDDWQDSLRQSLQDEPPPIPKKVPRYPALPGYAAIALVAIIVGALVGRYAFVGKPDSHLTKEAADAWVLIATPASQHIKPNVGDGLRAALRREVSGSYRSLPQRRIQTALSLMRADPATVLSPAIAREVALRDGQVSALLIPRLEQLGDTYVLSVEIIDPNDDKLIAYPSKKIDDLRNIPSAFERLAVEIRAGLLLLPDPADAAVLPQVTTSSLPALQLFSQAYRYLSDQQPLVAQELLTLAVREDPDFASARALQAWALQRQGATAETYLPISQEADALSAQLAPAERYFIEGSYRHFSGDLIRADASYRALLAINPDHLLGAQALLEICLSSKLLGDCVEQKVRLANIRPDDFESNLQAAWSLAATGDNIELATYYADKSQAIWRVSDQYVAPDSAARALIFPVISAWSTGDIETALHRSQQLTAVLPKLTIGTRNRLVEHLVEFSTMLGRIHEAEDLFDRLSDSDRRRELRARFLFASGNKRKLKSHLAADMESNQQVTALLMAISDLPEKAMMLHDDLRTQGMNDAKGAVIRARIAYDNGSLDTARSELQNSVIELTLDDPLFYFVGHDLHASVLEAEGQLIEAIHVLERTTPKRSDAAFKNAGSYWLKCQRHLAQLYRDAEREPEAVAVEKEIGELLLLADNDFLLVSNPYDI